MDAPEVACPLCGGKTIDGFIRDQVMGAHQAARWIQGAVKGGAFSDYESMFRIQAIRCEKCSHLLLFAKEKVFD